MGRVIRYVSQEKKTMDETGRRYLSTASCIPELAQAAEYIPERIGTRC